MKEKIQIGKDLILDLNGSLGQGGFGKVRKGILRDGKKQRIIAIKQIECKNENEEKLIQRERNNLEKIKQNKDKTWVVPFLGERKKDGKNYFLFQLYQGTLKQLIGEKSDIRRQLWQEKNKGFLDEKLLLSVLGQLCESLRKLHQNDIEHKDIKPENFLYRRYGQNIHQIMVSISDLGLSKQVTNKDKTTYVRVLEGTTSYFSPEIHLKENIIRFKADAWALGMVIYEFVFNEPFLEFKSENVEEVNEEIDEEKKKQVQQKQRDRYKAILTKAFEKLSQNLHRLYSRSQYGKQTKRSIELILKLFLEVNPRQRETPSDLHKFIQKSVRQSYHYLTSSIPKDLNQHYNKDYFKNKSVQEPIKIQKKREGKKQRGKVQIIEFMDDDMTAEEFEEIIELLCE